MKPPMYTEGLVVGIDKPTWTDAIVGSWAALSAPQRLSWQCGPEEGVNFLRPWANNTPPICLK